MKPNEKKAIAILVAITAVVIIIAIIMGNSGKKETKKEEQNNTTQGEEVTQLLNDGTLLNKSEKLHETKQFEGMEITNLQLTETEKETLLIGTVSNTSETKQGGYVALIKMVDKEGNEITTIETYIGELQPGKSMKFSTSANYDSSNVYDFTITKK